MLRSFRTSIKLYKTKQIWFLNPSPFCQLVHRVLFGSAFQFENQRQRRTCQWNQIQNKYRNNKLQCINFSHHCVFCSYRRISQSKWPFEVSNSNPPISNGLGYLKVRSQYSSKYTYSWASISAFLELKTLNYPGRSIFKLK